LIGVWAGRLLRKPIVLTIHGSDFRMARGGSRILKKIFLYVCQRARQIICVSEIQADGIKKMGVEGGKISVIPMGVDERFLEVGKDREKKPNGEGHIVLSNRNLLLLYNVPLLIRAIPKVIREEPKVKFFIAGDGPERENLEREVENLNLTTSVRFLGKVPHKEMPNLLVQSDIYVSTSPYDGTSVSLLEAMAAGAFPIVTDIPANREWIIGGENGYLFPAHNENLLARRILDAIHDIELLEKGRKRNRSVVEEKALWPVCIEKIKGIYEAQLSKSRHKGKEHRA
jgi:glycosyltransferase involved in cell wall biosynthesis